MQTEGRVTESTRKVEYHLGEVTGVIYVRNDEHTVKYARDAERMENIDCSSWYKLSVGPSANEVRQTLADQVIKDVLMRGLRPRDFRFMVATWPTVGRMTDIRTVCGSGTTYSLQDFVHEIKDEIVDPKKSISTMGMPAVMEIDERLR